MKTRRKIASRLAVALLAAPLGEAVAEPPLADLLIVDGEVHDGTGAAGRTADVAIRGDRIVYVGPDGETAVRAAHTIDASGLLVMPGFIDPHTHAGGDLLSDDPKRRGNLAYLH